MNDLMEKLAEIEHERWADWQKWCHKVLRENCPSYDLERVLERWDKQIATSYSDLSEQEKESDREQVRRYWNLITPAPGLREMVESAIKSWTDCGNRGDLYTGDERLIYKQCAAMLTAVLRGKEGDK